MSDLKRFLRFEISGYVVLLYACLFLLAFSDLEKLWTLITSGGGKIIDYSVTGFILAGPIGFIMHQIDISIFSPFRKCRWFFNNCRKVISVLEDRISNSKAKSFDDKKLQAMLELALSKDENKHLEKEISNRYSYYYARMEAGIFSPLFGLLIYFIANRCFQYIKNDTIFNFSWLTVIIITGIAIISLVIVAYCPTLLRELNDLECLAVEKGLTDTDFK